MKNKIISPSNFIFTFFFLSMVFSLTSCLPTKARSIKKWEKNEWKVVKVDKKDPATWRIYTRKIVGTNFLVYKIEGDIQSSSKACLVAFKQDLHMQADDTTNKKYPTYEISEESEESLLTYVIHAEPFPLKDTEMSVRYLFFENENGTTEVKWKEAWKDCPITPSKKLNRVETFRGSWTFSPTEPNACQAENSVQFDPKGMPLWLLEPMVFKFLQEGLENLRELPNTGETK